MPSFSALLAKSSFYELGDKGPSLGSILLNKFPDEVIFLVSPGFFPEKFRFVVV